MHLTGLITRPAGGTAGNDWHRTALMHLTGLITRPAGGEASNDWHRTALMHLTGLLTRLAHPACGQRPPPRRYPVSANG